MEELKIGKASLMLIQGDITKQDTDVIVNAANSSLMGGGGVDGAIHRAGGPTILDECKEIVAKQGRLPTGQAVITTGGKLPAKHVIHTVGPIWGGGTNNEPELLRDCYQNSLKIAKENSLKSISFPSISTGVYHYPVNQAAKVAIQTVVDFLKEHNYLERIYFVLFDGNTFNNYKEALTQTGDSI